MPKDLRNYYCEIMEKKIIGYTTGTFDMFHIGHLNILRQAKAQCDHLIVGVSTDELVEQYKGHPTIIPYAERLEIVRSIRYVDEVVPQFDRDKIAAFHRYNFDVMFVGDDWRNNAMFVEVEKYLTKYNARVVYFPYTKGTSSTLLRQKLQEK